MGLIEEFASKDNLNQVFLRVTGDKGASGIDNMTCDDVKDYLKVHGQDLINQIRSYETKHLFIVIKQFFFITLLITHEAIFNLRNGIVTSSQSKNCSIVGEIKTIDPAKKPPHGDFLLYCIFLKTSIILQSSIMFDWYRIHSSSASE